MENRTRVYKCTSCEAEITVPSGTNVRTMITGASGKPNMQVLLVDGEAVHRCETNTQISMSDEPESATPAQMS